jgi:hypothetical protein
MTKTTRTSGWQHQVSVNRSLKRKPTSLQAAPTALRRSALASGWLREMLADRSRFFSNETVCGCCRAASEPCVANSQTRASLLQVEAKLSCSPTAATRTTISANLPCTTPVQSAMTRARVLIRRHCSAISMSLRSRRLAGWTDPTNSEDSTAAMRSRCRDGCWLTHSVSAHGCISPTSKCARVADPALSCQAWSL